MQHDGLERGGRPRWPGFDAHTVQSYFVHFLLKKKVITENRTTILFDMYTHEGIFRGWHEGRTPEGSPEEIGPDP